jgi:hypothetical protein
MDQRGGRTVDQGWIRPALIAGALIALIALNIVEFRGKRRRDAAELAAFDDPGTLQDWLARRSYQQAQNIEQVVHIMNSVLIAILAAVLTL